MAKVLSVEIGMSNTRIVEMDYQTKKPRVYRCIEVPTPQGAVRDGYLDVSMMDKLAENIKTGLAENKIRTKRVLFTVFSGKIISREVVIPRVKTHQIATLVKSNVSEYFPVELDEYKITHMHINSISDGDGVGKHKVMVIAAEKALLAGYDRLAEDLGLRLVDIDYIGNSIYQSVRYSAGADAILAVKFEQDNAIITILKEGTMLLQRNINFRSNGRHAEDEPLSPKEVIGMLVNSLMRVIDFYLNNDEKNSISKIYLMGEGGSEEVVSRIIEKNTQIKCKPLSIVRGTSIQRRAEDARLCVFATAIGAGMASVGFANEKEKERHETNYVNACVLMVILFVVVIGAIMSMSLIPYETAKLEEKGLKHKEESLAQAKAIYDKYMGVKDLWGHIEYGNWLTENSNDAIIDFFAELEQKLPAEVEVTQFSSDDEQCVMAMRVSDKDTAAKVIDTLREFESVDTVCVSLLKEESDDSDISGLEVTNTMVSFEISCVYSQGADLEKPSSAAERAAAALAEEATVEIIQ